MSQSNQQTKHQHEWPLTTTVSKEYHTSCNKSSNGVEYCIINSMTTDASDNSLIDNDNYFKTPCTIQTFQQPSQFVEIHRILPWW
jgi:UDP-N-acetylglucosamine pyrophosphorylase